MLKILHQLYTRQPNTHTHPYLIFSPISCAFFSASLRARLITLFAKIDGPEYADIRNSHAKTSK